MALVVVGVVVLTGGDDEGRIATENTEPEDTEPDDTEPDDAQPDDTEPASTEAPGTTVPLTLPTTVVPATTVPPETTAAPETTTAPAGGPVGTTAPLTDGSAVIEATILAVADPAPTFEFLEPTPGTRAVAVQLRAVNVGTVEYIDSGIDLSLVDQAGARYESSFLPVPLSGFFPFTRVLPGDVRLGWVTFEVPEGVPLASFSWSIDDFNEQPVTWDLAAAPVAATPSPAPLPGFVPLNAPGTLVGSGAQVDLAVVNVVDDAPTADGFVVDPGVKLVAVEVALFNSGTTEFAEFPDGFVDLVDTGGSRVRSSFFPTALGPAFAGDLRLAPGEQAIAWIVYELPVDQAPLKLQAALDFGTAPQLAEFALA